MKGSSGNLSYKFSSFIVKHKLWFIGIFIALTIACGVTITLTKVNYDLSQYLPKNSDTNKAMTVLKNEFDDKGMLYVIVNDVTMDESAVIQKDIKEISGVASVIFDPRTGFNDEDKDGKGNLLLTVNFTDYDASKTAFDTTEKLEEYLSDKNAHMTGQSAFTYYTRAETFESIYKIGIVIVVIILLMMFFTSRTYFELIPMILVFGVSVLLNMGTNYWFNGISYVSNLVALVLQLALSIDYSVILLHRFMEKKESGLDAKEAAVQALAKGAPEILSSSFTTIAGLASLLLMSLPIGVEIGLSLAKSIVFSLISVLFLMPALLVIFQKPLEKTKHKNFVPNVTRPARAIVKARKVIVPVFLIIIILSAVGQAFNTYAFNMNGGSKIVVGQEAAKDSGFGTLNTFVVIVPKGDYEKEHALSSKLFAYGIIDGSNSLSGLGTASIDDANIQAMLHEKGLDNIYITDSYTRAELDNLITPLIAGTEYESYKPVILSFFNVPEGADEATYKMRLIDLLEVISTDSLVREALGNMDISGISGAEILSYLDQLVFAKNNLEGEKYTRMTFNINSGIEDTKTFEFITQAKKDVAEFYDESYTMGESVVCYEMAQAFPKDNAIVSVCIICFVLAILLIMFKNLALPVILVLAIEGGVFINFVIPFLAHNSVSFIGYLIISAIQMGATIDYAIVLTNRYLTTKHEFPDRLDAMAAAENAVFPTIITSGIILTVTGFTLAGLASGVVAGLGLLMGIGAAVSMLIVIFVLPSLLLVTEGIFSRADFKDVFRKKKKIVKDDETEA